MPSRPAPAPFLVFAYGNPSRGDDALGPRFAERIEALELPGVECLTDFQLQVEHALDLRGRKKVLFVDASLYLDQSFRVSGAEAARDASFSSHALSPAGVLHAYGQLNEGEPPPAWVLAIRAQRFELGEDLSPLAADALDEALQWAVDWLAPVRSRRLARRKARLLNP